MQIGYKIQDKFDFLIFIPALLLVLIGLGAIYSATASHPTAYGNFDKQLVAALISFTLLFIIFFIPEKIFKLSAIPSYVLALVLLIVVLLVGKTVYGAKSWISLGGSLGFQPSEFAKVAMILLLAQWLSYQERDINTLKDIGIALGIGFIPIGFILLQPDMGTAIVFIIITLTLIFWKGISIFGLFVVLSPGFVIFASLFGVLYHIIAIVCVVAALFLFKRDLFNSVTILIINLGSAFFFEYLFKFLKPHQQQRILSFLDPTLDPLGSGYNATQAKVAIGSGGFFGKGFLQGNQTQLRFIPEQWTDFIYCVIGEEFGFLGSAFVLVLFLVLFLRLLKLSTTAKDDFSRLVIIGVLALFFTHFALNIGMNIGITPVIGLPLPFLSYGGSSLLVNVVLLGIVLNIYRNRKLHI